MVHMFGSLLHLCTYVGIYDCVCKCKYASFVCARHCNCNVVLEIATCIGKCAYARIDMAACYQHTSHTLTLVT